MHNKSLLSKITLAFLDIHDALCKYCFYFAATILFLMALIIGYEVAFRYFFVRPTSWVLDFSEYILIYSTFLAAPWLYKIGGHTSVSIVVDMANTKLRFVLEAISRFVTLIACGTIIYLGVSGTWEAYERNVLIIRPIIIPKYLILWTIPFGLFLLFVYLLENLFTLTKSLRKDGNDSI